MLSARSNFSADPYSEINFFLPLVCFIGIHSQSFVDVIKACPLPFVLLLLVPDRRLYIKGFLDGSCLNRDGGEGGGFGFDSFDGGGREVICGLGVAQEHRSSTLIAEKFALNLQILLIFENSLCLGEQEVLEGE